MFVHLTNIALFFNFNTKSLYKTIICCFCSKSNINLTLLTLSNFNGLFQSMFWIDLKRYLGVKGLMEHIEMLVEFIALHHPQFDSIMLS